MANKYLVWKDANCNGVNPEWIEMDGRNFYEFTKVPANKHRRFIRLGNEVCKEADVIYIEATKLQYDEWHAEDYKRYQNMKDKKEHPYKMVSFNDNTGELHNLTFDEVVTDDSISMEQEVINKLYCEEVRKIVLALSLEEKFIIELMFYGPNILSERCAAKELGISNDTLHSKKVRIFKKIKKSFKQN